MLLWRDEAEALVEVGQSGEVAVDHVYYRLDDRVPTRGEAPDETALMML